MLRLLAIVLLISYCLAVSHPWTPEPRDQHWIEKHEHYLNNTIENGKEAQIVFIGDSITENWKSNGKTVWHKYYTSRHAFNYGIGGDRTENVLWRIQHKEFDGLKPKVVVLMIGTNNVLGNTIEDIAHGVNETVRQLRFKMPESKMILLGILPKNHERYGEKPKQLNVLLKKLADGNNVYWLDMWDAFETKDGKQNTDLFVADLVHPQEAGYEVWAKTMEPLLNQLLLAHPWVPEPKDGSWMTKHQEFLNQTHIHGKEAQIVFIGDSITAHWLIEGKDVWAKYYATRHAFNYGIGGDRTEHVLWRVENKEFDGLKPKVAVLMIGTNNLGASPIEDIAKGVQTILKQLELKMPATKVLLLALLPKAEPASTLAKNLNVLLKKFADEKTVYWLDMWSAFTTSDGKKRTELYVDGTHLNASGYEVWHKTMEPILTKLDPAQ